MSNNHKLNNPGKKNNRIIPEKNVFSGNSAPQNGNSIPSDSKYFLPQKKLSIRLKTILIAIAMSVIPVSIVGATTYLITKRSANQEILEAQEQVAQTQLAKTTALAEEFHQFLQARFLEVEMLSENTIFTDPNLWNSATLEQKEAILNSFQSQNNIYEQIIFLDLQGNTLFRSQLSKKSTDNYSDREYIKEAITSKKIVVNKPGLNDNGGKLILEYVAPIINAWTGKVTGIIYISLPEEQIEKIFIDYTNNNQQWYLIDNEGVFFAGSNQEYLNSPAKTFFPDITNFYVARKIGTGIYSNQLENNQQLVSYAPVTTHGFYPDKYLGAIITTEVFPKLIALENGSWILLLGIGTTVLVVGAIAAYLANFITNPIIKSIQAVELLSQGKLDTRIPIQGKDELAMLGLTINQMAEKLMYLIERQTMLAKTSELISRISRARNIQQLQSPLNKFLAEVRSVIKADRLIFYQFDQDWFGTVIAESVAKGFPKAFGSKIEDPCFAQNYVDKYLRGRIQATRNIYEAGLTQCHLKQLEDFSVKSNLVIPIVLDKETNKETGELIGLLIAHQCASTRLWTDPEIDYLKEVASQLGLALRGYGFYKQVLEKQENFAQETIEIIDKYQDLSRGNLTIKYHHNQYANSLLLEFLNNLIRDWRKIVTSIKNDTLVVRDYINNNRIIISELKQQISEQSKQIEQIVTTIEPITYYAQTIDRNINDTLQISGIAINQTETGKTNLTHSLKNISQLQKTVVETVKKIKEIEQYSLGITVTVPMIKKIAMQAEILADKVDKQNIQNIENQDSINQNINKLAIQLVAITTELETIGENIQKQTLEIVRKIEIDSAQVLGATPIVEDSTKTLTKIFDTSVAIDRLLQSSANLNTSQITSFQKITNLLTKLTQLSERSFYQSQQADNSLEATEVALQKLQKSVDTFEIETQ